MASDEQDVEVTERGRRGRRPSSKPKSDGNPGLLKVLWADLRKQPVPSEPDPDEEAWFEEEEELRRAEGAKVGKVHSIGAEHLDALRQRYWNGS